MPRVIGYLDKLDQASETWVTLRMNTKDLPTLPCPRCKIALSAGTPGTYIAHSAGSFEECLRRCEACGIGLSNSRTAGSETRIYAHASDNVPEVVRKGFIEALESGANELNRRNKKLKAAFSTSEDALTWTVFRWLQLEQRLASTFFSLGFNIARGMRDEPRLLLWGAEVPLEPKPNSDSRLVKTLRDISHTLGEQPDRRTEPDVVLDFGAAGVIFIEVKYQSANEIKSPTYPNWQRYLNMPDPSAFRDGAAIRENGHYELARNWRFGWQISKQLEVPVTVINLGRTALFNGLAGGALARFEALLSQNDRRQFARLTWSELLGNGVQCPTWFMDYIDDKRLLRKARHSHDA